MVAVEEVTVLALQPLLATQRNCTPLSGKVKTGVV
jgi:hypothetical protein